MYISSQAFTIESLALGQRHNNKNTNKRLKSSKNKSQGQGEKFQRHF